MQLLEPKRVILFRGLDRNTMVFLPPGSLVLFSIPVVVAKLEIIQCTFTKKRQSNLTLVSFPPLSLSLKRKTSAHRLNCGPSRTVSPTGRTAPAAGTAGWRSGGIRWGPPPLRTASAGGDC